MKFISKLTSWPFFYIDSQAVKIAYEMNDTYKILSIGHRLCCLRLHLGCNKGVAKLSNISYPLSCLIFQVVKVGHMLCKDHI